MTERPALSMWADVAGAEGEALREQLQRLMAIVPQMRRARILGAITSAKRFDERARDAVYSLTLAKTFADHGWTVEFEPGMPDGSTPDLKISKAGVEHVVEVRRVTGKSHGWDKTGPLRKALAEVRTKTPMRVIGYGWDGRTSFKGFKAHLLKQLSATPRPEGPQSFCEGGFSIAYEFVGELGRESSAIFSTSARFSGSDRARVREAINEKLARYKCPLIVALDLAGVHSPFETVEEVIYGEIQFIVPVSTTATEFEQRRREPIRQQRAPGLFHGGGHDAIRARERLEGVLAFECSFDIEQKGLTVRPCFFANPSTPEPNPHTSFAPFPRSVVTKREGDLAWPTWVNAEGSNVPSRPSWRYVP